MTDLTDHFYLINQPLLIFKLYVYSAREKDQVNILQIKFVINKIKDVELNISKNEPKNVKSIARNGNLFSKHDKINGAWLGVKMNEKMGGWVDVLICCYKLAFFLLLFFSLFLLW